MRIPAPQCERIYLARGLFNIPSKPARSEVAVEVLEISHEHRYHVTTILFPMKSGLWGEVYGEE